MPNIKTLSTIQNEVESINRIALSVDCVIFGFDEHKLKLLVIRCDLKEFKSLWSLLGDLVDPHEELDVAAMRILKNRTGPLVLYLPSLINKYTTIITFFFATFFFVNSHFCVDNNY